MDDLRQDSQKTRLVCQRNTLPCAPSILKHHVSAEVCLLGHQWISRGFTLTQYLEKGSVPSVCAKLKDSLDTDYPRNEERHANQFFSRNVLLVFLWDPTLKRQYPNSPPPKRSISFRLGRPIQNMFSIFQDDRSTTWSNRMGLFYNSIAFNEDMPSSNQQQSINCKNRYFWGSTKHRTKRPLPKRL